MTDKDEQDVGKRISGFAQLIKSLGVIGGLLTIGFGVGAISSGFFSDFSKMRDHVESPHSNGVPQEILSRLDALEAAALPPDIPARLEALESALGGLPDKASIVTTAVLDARLEGYVTGSALNQYVKQGEKVRIYRRVNRTDHVLTTENHPDLEIRRGGGLNAMTHPTTSALWQIENE